MDSKTRYRFKEKQFQERVEAFASDPAILDLSAEIGQVRALLEATGPNNPALSASLIQTIGRLVSNLQRHQLAQTYLLTQSTVFQLTKELQAIVSRNLRHIPGYEDILLKIREEVNAAVANAKNDPQEVETILKGKALPPPK